MERLLLAAEQAGHSVSLLSTNGYDGMQYWSEARARQEAGRLAERMAGAPFDIDIKYTIPKNFPERFLRSSRVKIGRFDYESSVMPPFFRENLNVPDYLVASSAFVADVFRQAGANERKIRIIHSGVDRSIFNEEVKPLDLKKLGIEGSPFVFLSVAEPHYRKQLDRLLQIFCERFTSSDDVVLIIKTKLFEPGEYRQGFEQDLRPYLAALKNKYGAKMPQIKVLGKRMQNLAPLYRAAHAFCLPTVGEGWGMPFLEAMSCGSLVIAPNHGGQLEFLNKNNSVLCPVKISPALPQEQYGTYPFEKLDWKSALEMPKGVVARPDEAVFGDMLVAAYKNYSSIIDPLRKEMRATSDRFTWAAAANQMLGLAK
jgi:glycosyltransferase involved in cell wall biosynthesis